MPSLDHRAAAVPLVAPAHVAPASSSMADPYAVATLATLNSSAFRERTLPLLAMVSLTTAAEDVAEEERAARLELAAAGWQRIDGNGNEIGLDTVVSASAARPELFLLPSARTGVFSFRGINPDVALQDLCASDCAPILAPPSSPVIRASAHLTRAVLECP